jgi:hypothetical protein
MSERETCSAFRNKNSKSMSVSSGTKRNKSVDNILPQTNIEREKNIIQETYRISNKSVSEDTDNTITSTKKRTKTHNEHDEDTHITEKNNTTHY